MFRYEFFLLLILFSQFSSNRSLPRYFGFNASSSNDPVHHDMTDDEDILEADSSSGAGDIPVKNVVAPSDVYPAYFRFALAFRDFRYDASLADRNGRRFRRLAARIQHSVARLFEFTKGHQVVIVLKFSASRSPMATKVVMDLGSVGYYNQASLQETLYEGILTGRIGEFEVTQEDSEFRAMNPSMPADRVGCGAGRAVCFAGDCFQTSRRCDGFSDCSDGTDEFDCVARSARRETTPTPTKSRADCPGFVCDDNQCIDDAGHACDGRPDCFDASDEFGCVLPEKPEIVSGKRSSWANKYLLEWHVRERAAVQGFNLRWRVDEEEEEWSHAFLSADAETFLIKGLKSSTRYKAALSAINGVGATDVVLTFLTRSQKTQKTSPIKVEDRDKRKKFKGEEKEKIKKVSKDEERETNFKSDERKEEEQNKKNKKGKKSNENRKIVDEKMDVKTTNESIRARGSEKQNENTDEKKTKDGRRNDARRDAEKNEKVKRNNGGKSEERKSDKERGKRNERKQKEGRRQTLQNFSGEEIENKNETRLLVDGVEGKNDDKKPMTDSAEVPAASIVLVKEANDESRGHENDKTENTTELKVEDDDKAIGGTGRRQGASFDQGESGPQPHPASIQDCDAEKISCWSGGCVKGRLCDGLRDCVDGSDESTTRCGVGIAEDTFKIEVFPQSSVVGVGVTAVFRCYATLNDSSGHVGRAAPVVLWQRQGNSSMPASATDDGNGVLTIKKTASSDSGAYVCTLVGSSNDHPGSAIATLDVVEPPPITCSPTQFICGSGDCVPAAAVCDRRFDCPDESDEEHCVNNDGGVSLDCQPNQLRCPTGECVKNFWRCDGDKDCSDSWDEWRCTAAFEPGIANDAAENSLNYDSFSPPSRCDVSEWECVSGGCIPNSFVADGESDCADQSDERGASPPKIVRAPPARLMVCPGATAEIECAAVGFPTPIVSWRRDWGHTCAASDPARCQVWAARDGTGRISIEGARSDDEGLYTCEAQNRRGTAFAHPSTLLVVSSEACGKLNQG